VTVTVYVLVVVVSCAVTTTAIAVLPTLRACALDALPDVTALPPTVNVESISVAVGVTVTDAMPLSTLAVYDMVAAANVGESTPELNDSVFNDVSVNPAVPLVKVTAYVLVAMPSPAVTITLIAAFAPTAIA
jgi:hypothetical protein